MATIHEKSKVEVHAIRIGWCNVVFQRESCVWVGLARFNGTSDGTLTRD